MEDEAGIRALLADGDNAGDDRRFKPLYKAILRLMQQPASERDELLDKCFKFLDMTEVAMRRQTMVHAMNEQQAESYKRLCSEMETQYQRAQESIAEAKVELTHAKLVRRNRQEYDLMAKMIQQQPSRIETNSKLIAVRQDLQNLGERQKRLESKLVERRNNLHAFGITLSYFKEAINENHKEEGAEATTAVGEEDSSEGEEMDET